MPLTDSFLLDPLAPPRMDVWIALHSDGARGSGTEDDPYDGSTWASPIVPVSNLTSIAQIATATVAVGHGFKDGDLLVISGVTGTDAWLYNGSYQITNVTSTMFRYTLPFAPQSGSTSGTRTCRFTPYRLDAVMAALPASPPTAVHLGPGVFETRGYAIDTYTNWSARSGGKIAGSGMGVTTLKLVEASIPGLHYVAIGSDIFLDGFEVCDLTIDCNMAGQPVPVGADYAPVTCGAIGLRGTRLKIRRVRAINAGTALVNRECFVIFVGQAAPTLPEVVDCAIENCVVEQPSMVAAQIVSCLTISKVEGSIPYQAVPVFHRGCAIRNCVVDCYYRANPVRIASITFSGTMATVTTVVPHGRSSGSWVRIAGAYVNGSILNPFNGSFAISNVFPNTFQYTMPATPATAPAGELWLDRFPSHAVSIASITQVDAINRIYEITTDTPHYRIANDPVSPQSIKVHSGASNSTYYNGLFKVESVSSPTKFTYRLNSIPPPGEEPPDLSVAAVGWEYHAIGASGGTAAAEEGNRVYGATFGSYDDTFSTKDVTIRNNYYHDVVEGVYYNMGLPGKVTTFTTGQQITYDPATLVATFNTPFAHGLLPRTALLISGATVNGNNPPAKTYNDLYEVLDVPTSTSFRYQMLMSPGQPAGQEHADPGTGQYQEIWRIRRLVIENNIVELSQYLTGVGPSFGINLANYPNTSGFPNIYLQSVIRNNIIREVNDAPDPYSVGISLWRCENAVIEHNVIDSAVGTPLTQFASGALEYFGNATSGGALIQGYDTTQSRKVDELTTRIEDSLIISIL